MTTDPTTPRPTPADLPRYTVSDAIDPDYYCVMEDGVVLIARCGRIDMAERFAAAMNAAADGGLLGEALRLLAEVSDCKQSRGLWQVPESTMDAARALLARAKEARP